MSIVTMKLPPTPSLPADAAAVLDQLPLPLTPAEAWRRLDPVDRDALGTIAVAMVLTAFLAGQDRHPDERLLDDAGQYDAQQASDRLLDLVHGRIEALLPELFGTEDGHPAWAIKAGLGRRS